ncbi:hypothetical protein [Treponema brennaborense]|uniref:PBS lyase HEAT domain protein repeat-containing protein n=1 Tax=Treponema brennaborense (strain DSM 12168 / CIP 105900 / DD5/3) TaxID=906968 RepID=F4LM45_TREBD|nr:hypothetical protein [Treponema brennaborense]AEE16724.1 hypothetical protein Trebr_1297 [Treponema brennaborense DSM 12168]
MKRNSVKRIALCAAFFVHAAAFTAGDSGSDPVIDFITGSVADKTAVLRELVVTPDTPADVRRLPQAALEFVRTYVPVTGNGHGMTELAAAAVPFYGTVTVQSDADLLWQIFQLSDDDTLRSSILRLFSASAGANRSLFVPYIPNLHTLLAEYVASEKYSSAVCLDIVGMLGSVADAQSFDPLFRLITADYDSALTAQAVSAIQHIIPESRTAIVKTLRSDSVSAGEKLQLFTLLQKNSENSDFFKAEIAENVLAVTIINGEDISSVTPDIAALQLAAMREIARTGWPKASATVAAYFAAAGKELQAGLIRESDFIEIIVCLEKMATTQAVSVLTEYLGSLNKEVAAGGVCREPVVLAVITALGTLGDKTSFDNLLYVTYLPYTDTVIAAARNALADLKW